MLRYPVVLEPDDNGTTLVSFPDFPEAHTFGRHETDALRRAVDALETVIMAYMEKQRDIPAPSAVRRRHSITLPALSEAKVALYQEMRKSRIRRADLARRLGWQTIEVDHLLDLNHPSRLDQIEAALRALNKRLSIQIHDAA